MDYCNYSPEQLFNEIQMNRVKCFEGIEGHQKEKFAKQASDNLIRMVDALGYGTSKLSHFCKAGCAYCCTHLFSITSTEATAITYYLLNKDEVLLKFINNFLNIQEKIPNKVALRDECSPSDREQTPYDFGKYFSYRIPCDFLAADGLCIIYETRPLICSAYISIAPARLCSFEPKARIPLEARKYYFESLNWLEAQARRRYQDQPVLITNFSQKIIDGLLTGNF